LFTNEFCGFVVALAQHFAGAFRAGVEPSGISASRMAIWLSRIWRSIDGHRSPSIRNAAARPSGDAGEPSGLRFMAWAISAGGQPYCSSIDIRMAPSLASTSACVLTFCALRKTSTIGPTSSALDADQLAAEADLVALALVLDRDGFVGAAVGEAMAVHAACPARAVEHPQQPSPWQRASSGHQQATLWLAQRLQIVDDIAADSRWLSTLALVVSAI
jgi:hypothetical protein